MIMELVCDGNLNNIFYILKTILDIIMIIAPILAIVSLVMHIFNGTIDPDNKKNLTKFKNTIKALMIIFMIPLLINIVTSIVGEKTSLTSCWNNTKRSSIKIKYYDKKEKKSKKTKVYTDPKKYHGKTNAPSTSSNVSSNLNFTCTSTKVKSKFSCDTLRIVEKHLYDFDATNFDKVIASYGGFDSYAKSVGGIFGEYYGKKIPNNTEADFQQAAEYVLGWMYMYGWDYKNGFGKNEGHHNKWGGNNYSSDAFYVNGGWERKYVPDYEPYSRKWWTIGTNFDHVISGKNGGVGAMSSECGDLEDFVYNKLGIVRDKQVYPKVTKLRDLKVGDGIYFGKCGSWNMNDESTWKSNCGAHNVVVGEVYSNRIVIYDAAGGFQSHKNYKHIVYFPNSESKEAEKEALSKAYGDLANNWGVRRWHNFK